MNTQPTFATSVPTKLKRRPLVPLTKMGRRLKVVPPYVKLDVGVLNTITNKIVPSVSKDKSFKELTHHEWLGGLARTSYLATYYCENLVVGDEVMNPREGSVTMAMLQNLLTRADAESDRIERLSISSDTFKSITLSGKIDHSIQTDFESLQELLRLQHDSAARNELIKTIKLNQEKARHYIEQTNIILEKLGHAPAKQVDHEKPSAPPKPPAHLEPLEVSLAPVPVPIEMSTSPFTSLPTLKRIRTEEDSTTEPNSGVKQSRPPVKTRPIETDEQAVSKRFKLDLDTAPRQLLETKREEMIREIALIETKPLVGWNKYWHNQKSTFLSLIKRKLEALDAP